MPESLNVRVSGPGDLAAVDTLLARSYPRLLRPDYPPSVMVTALPLIARANPALLNCGTYYVAEDEEGEIVGAGGWTRAAPGGGGAQGAHVRHVVTDDRRLRRGIGRRLMDRVIGEARASGLRRLQCQSTRTAVAFYGACGFEVLGEIEVMLAPGVGFPAVAMELTL